MRRIIFLLFLSGMILTIGCTKEESVDLTPNFEVSLLSGDAYTSSDIAGKVAVIDFWATWCGPCISEIPYYNKLNLRYKEKGLVVLGVAIDSGSKDAISAFAKKHKIWYPVAVGSSKTTEAFGGVRSIPTTFLLDRNGRVIKQFIGTSPMKKKKLEAEIANLLGTTS